MRARWLALVLAVVAAGFYVLRQPGSKVFEEEMLGRCQEVARALGLGQLGGRAVFSQGVADFDMFMGRRYADKRKHDASRSGEASFEKAQQASKRLFNFWQEPSYASLTFMPNGDVCSIYGSAPLGLAHLETSVSIRINGWSVFDRVR